MNEEAAEVGTRVVLITGCSTGIGLSTAVILAEDVKRFKVYATMRNLEKKSELENAAGKHLGESLITIISQGKNCFHGRMSSFN